MSFATLYERLPEWMVKGWWDRQWPKAQVVWDFNTNGTQDVRRALDLSTDDVIALRTVLAKMQPLPSDDDSKVKHIMSSLLTEFQEDVPVGFGGNYDTDSHLHQRPDFWQNPSMTLQLGKGDCDDWGILLYGLLRLAGIPTYRLKCVITDVIKNGQIAGAHFDLIYLARTDYEWYTLEGSWFPSYALSRYLNQPRKDSADLYGQIYCTFNEEYVWAQHDFLLKPLFLTEGELS